MLEPIVKPAEETLQGFLLGTLTNEEADQVVAWLASDAAATDWLLQSAREPFLSDSAVLEADPEALVSDEAVNRVIENVHRIIEAGGEAFFSPSPQTPLSNLDTLVPTPRPLPKQIGDYRVLRCHGEGGMGVVYEAYDNGLSRHVAIKVMKDKLTNIEEAKARFYREAKAAASIIHENVVPIYQVGEDNGKPFIVMPLLKGKSLDGKLSGGRHLSVPEIIRLAREVASGLAAAHERGLIHRDIKPSNIWLEEGSGKACILDFGLAKSEDPQQALTQSGTIIGTPAYMSPEQADGKPLDIRADLFSLGCVLYRTATGKGPFDRPTITAILSALAKDTPPSPQQFNPDIPPSLSALIMQLLAKNPAQRVPDAPTLLKALGEIVAETESPRLDRVWPKSIIGLGMVFFFIATLGVVYFTFPSKDGTLTIEVADEAEVAYKNGELHIKEANGKVQYILKPGQLSKALPAGRYTVQLVGADGILLDTPEIIIKKGETVPLRVHGHVEHDRKAAEFIRSLGGTFRIDGGTKDYLDELPREEFQLTAVSLARNLKVTDENLAIFKGCTNILELNLSGTLITDKGLINFKDCTKIVQLILNEAKVTASGLANFKNCTRLTRLYLSECVDVDDTALAHFSQRKDMDVVNLRKTNITADGLRHIRGNKNLLVLNLEHTEIGDTGLTHLESFKKLQVLALNHTKVSDAGVPALIGLNQLVELGVDKTKITVGGIAKLQTALPECVIEWNSLKFGPNK